MYFINQRLELHKSPAFQSTERPTRNENDLKPTKLQRSRVLKLKRTSNFDHREFKKLTGSADTRSGEYATAQLAQIPRNLELRNRAKITAITKKVFCCASATVCVPVRA